MNRCQVPGRQQGVALALVVWFIAGMSLLVAGIVAQARVDGRMTQVHLGRAKAVAAGDGAIVLAMAERRQGYSSSSAGPLISESVYALGDLNVTVRLYPAAGLVDLNTAPAEVLAALFALAGGVSPEEAQLTADNVVKWRKGADTGSRRKRRGQRFYAPVDLLRVEGATRTLLDGIRPYSVAGGWTKGTMNWSAAPDSILGLLESLSPGQVNSVMGRRDSLIRAADSQGAGSRSAGGQDSRQVFRADALVDYGGRTWLRRRWLAPGSSSDSNLPWRVVRTEAPRVVEG